MLRPIGTTFTIEYPPDPTSAEPLAVTLIVYEVTRYALNERGEQVEVIEPLRIERRPVASAQDTP